MQTWFCSDENIFHKKLWFSPAFFVRPSGESKCLSLWRSGFYGLILKFRLLLLKNNYWMNSIHNNIINNNISLKHPARKTKIMHFRCLDQCKPFNCFFSLLQKETIRILFNWLNYLIICFASFLFLCLFMMRLFFFSLQIWTSALTQSMKKRI